MVELVETIVRRLLFDLAAATKDKDETIFAAAYERRRSPGARAG